MTNFIRVLVLAGAVMLTYALGSVTGSANQLLAAQPTTAPVNYAVKANNDFGVDLYAQLAKDKANEGKNLFFSPYSMSSALAMTAEGARGETAEQMGKTLRFPDAAKRTGDDAKLLPWKTAVIHTGFAALNERFNDKPGAKEIRAKIADLCKQHDAARQQLDQLNKAGKQADAEIAWQKMQQLAEELHKLTPKVDPYQLSVANALWGEQTYPFEKTYVDTIDKFYGTGRLFEMNFKGEPEACRLKINDWAARQTHDRIKDLIPKGGVDTSTRLVLTNTVYFMGEWEEVFWADATKDEDFLRSDGKKIRAAMMYNHEMHHACYTAFKSDGKFFDTPELIDVSDPASSNPKRLYPDAGGFEALEMPYNGGDLSMVVIVPRTADKIADLEKKLTAANLQAWLGKLTQRDVEVFVPKFKVETGSQQMKPSLQAMGMIRAFETPGDPKGAQFDGMCASKDPALKLYITHVNHKAYVNVDERGTEAAAATDIGMGIGACPRGKMQPFVPTFRADKPFIFLIRDRKTDTILFLGRIMDPKQ